MHYIDGINAVTPASCLKQNKAAPMPRAWDGRRPQAGLGSIGVFPLPALLTCIAKPRCPSRTSLKTRGALKPGHCPSSMARARTHHAAAVHPHMCAQSTRSPTRCLPARSRSRTSPGHDPRRPGRQLDAPAQPRHGVRVLLALAWAFLFFQSSFPLVLSSSSGMGKTPSARLCHGI